MYAEKALKTISAASPPWKKIERVQIENRKTEGNEKKMGREIRRAWRLVGRGLVQTHVLFTKFDSDLLKTHELWNTGKLPL